MCKVESEKKFSHASDIKQEIWGKQSNVEIYNFSLVNKMGFQNNTPISFILWKTYYGRRLLNIAITSHLYFSSGNQIFTFRMHSMINTWDHWDVITLLFFRFSILKLYRKELDNWENHFCLPLKKYENLVGK